MFTSENSNSVMLHKSPPAPVDVRTTAAKTDPTVIRLPDVAGDC